MAQSESEPVESEQIANQIREFAASVDNPDDWMIIVPVEQYENVKERLDTTRNVSTYYKGISLCYGDKDYDETQVRLRTSLGKYLRTLDAE